MKRIFQLLLVATVTCMSTTAIAQKSIQELPREIESINRAAQVEMQKMEADTARRQAEINRLRAETDRLRIWYKSQENSDRAHATAERAEQAEAEQVEAARMAEEAAEELLDEIVQSAVRTKNNIYLGITLVFVAGFVAYFMRQSRKELIMQENQKFGIAVIVGAGLVLLLAIVISDDWVYHFDFLQNLMSSLRIKLFVNEERFLDIVYYIDIPTKYVVLTCICVAAYGLTTYLGVTPVLRKKS